MIHHLKGGVLAWKFIAGWFILVNLADPALPLKSIIIVNALAAIPACVAALVSWHNARKAQELHLQINSRFDEFMALNKDAAFKAGELAGRLAADTERKAAAAKTVLHDAAFQEGAQSEKDKKP